MFTKDSRFDLSCPKCSGPITLDSNFYLTAQSIEMRGQDFSRHRNDMAYCRRCQRELSRDEIYEVIKPLVAQREKHGLTILAIIAVVFLAGIAAIVWWVIF